MRRLVVTCARVMAGVMTASLGAAAVASSAAATVPQNGSGYGIADDTYMGLPAAAIPGIYGEDLARLQTRAFRFQILWNADQATIDKAKTLIDYVRTQGVQQVMVTFKKNGAAPSPATYETNIRRIISQLASRVDAWGAANEPNHGDAWLPGTSGAATLGGYWQRFVAVLNNSTTGDPTAIKVSPEFADRRDRQPLSAAYMNAYVQAGGGFGDVAGWHAYWDVHFRGAPLPGTNPPRSSTADFLRYLPAGKRVWVTEVGAFGLNAHDPSNVINDPESLQGEKVDWLARQPSGLAQSSQIDKIFYYHLRGATSDWDTGLTRNNGVRRPGWYTWCAMAHGGNSGHWDCLPPAGVNRLAVITGGATTWIKEGLPGGQWLLMAGGDVGGRDVELDGGRLALVSANGSVWLRDPLPGGSWDLLGGPEFDARDVELSGDRMAVIAGNGAVWLKNGLPGAAWDLMAGPEFAARDIELNGDRLAVVAGNGTVWLKNGLPGSAWDLLGGPEFAAQDVELNGDRMAVITGNGAVWLKNGLPGAAWDLMGGPEFAARDIELNGDRLTVIAGNGAIWLKNGLPGSAWDLMGGPEFAARDVELRGDRLAVIAGNGAIWLKNGLPGSAWDLMGGPEFDGRDLAVY